MKIVADINQPLIEEYFGRYGDIIRMSPEEIDNDALLKAGADVLLCRSTIKVNEALLKNTQVKYVGTCTIGYDHVDLNYLHKKQIGFGSAPGCNANSVGEYMVAALIKLALKYKYDLKDKTLGVIGVGNVGRRVVEKAQALGMNVLCNDPPRERDEGSAGFTDLDELLKQSDFVTLHVPLIKTGVDRTLGLAGEEFFGKIKKGGVFVNASRGVVASGKAIAAAYERGQISEYIVDVFEDEPNVSHELVEKAFIATEHISGHSVDGKINGTRIVFESFIKHFSVDVQGGIQDNKSKELREIVIPPELSGMRGVEYAVDCCYDIIQDSNEFKAAPDRFKELRMNYKVRYEFSHYSVKGSERETLDILDKLGFGRVDFEDLD